MSAGPAGAAGEFETLLYGVADAVATITLNRPDSFADDSQAPPGEKPDPNNVIES